MTRQTGPSRAEKAAMSLCALVLSVSLWHAVKSDVSAAYGLATVAFLLLMGIASVSVLDYKLSIQSLSIQRRVNTLEAENQRLKEATEALLRSYYVLMDVVQYPTMGGPTINHFREIDKQLTSIADLFPSGLESETLKRVEGFSQLVTDEEMSMRPSERLDIAKKLNRTTGS